MAESVLDRVLGSVYRTEQKHKLSKCLFVIYV